MRGRLHDHYFAYGSNMNPARVAERGLAVVSARGARLAGVALAFDKCSAVHPGIGHANLVTARAGHVEGVLYALSTGDEIAKMDAFEHTPINYSRERVCVETAAGVVIAWTYFANPAMRRTGLRPDRAYLAHLLAGRRYLSPAYFESLLRVPCVDGSREGSAGD
jgi:gamma-glutamylcyclotransferase (GGCT)/AIG2-like uncharacterized protein YtfP